MSTIPIDDKLVIGPDRANIDARYKASNNRPYTSVAAAEAAINLVIGNVGLTVLVADENDPDYPKAKEYWVQPKGTTPETYGLLLKGSGDIDIATEQIEGGTRVIITDAEGTVHSFDVKDGASYSTGYYYGQYASENELPQQTTMKGYAYVATQDPAVYYVYTISGEGGTWENSEEKFVTTQLETNLASKSQTKAPTTKAVKEGIESVDVTTEQEFTSTQKETARTNIGAQEDITSMQNVQPVVAALNDRAADIIEGTNDLRALGYKILDPSVPFEQQCTQDNTVYEIRERVTLSGTALMGKNTSIRFNGGSIFGESGGIIVGDYTKIEDVDYQVFYGSITFQGIWEVQYVRPEWWGAEPFYNPTELSTAKDSTNAVQKSVDFWWGIKHPLDTNTNTYNKGEIRLSRGCYKLVPKVLTKREQTGNTPNNYGELKGCVRIYLSNNLLIKGQGKTHTRIYVDSPVAGFIFFLEMYLITEFSDFSVVGTTNFNGTPSNWESIDEAAAALDNVPSFIGVDTHGGGQKLTLKSLTCINCKDAVDMTYSYKAWGDTSMNGDTNVVTDCDFSNLKHVYEIVNSQAVANQMISCRFGNIFASAIKSSNFNYWTFTDLSITTPSPFLQQVGNDDTPSNKVVFTGCKWELNLDSWGNKSRARILESASRGKLDVVLIGCGFGGGGTYDANHIGMILGNGNNIKFIGGYYNAKIQITPTTVRDNNGIVVFENMPQPPNIEKITVASGALAPSYKIVYKNCGKYGDWTTYVGGSEGAGITDLANTSVQYIVPNNTFYLITSNSYYNWDTQTNTSRANNKEQIVKIKRNTNLYIDYILLSARIQYSSSSQNPTYIEVYTDENFKYLYGNYRIDGIGLNDTLGFNLVKINLGMGTDGFYFKIKTTNPATILGNLTVVHYALFGNSMVSADLTNKSLLTPASGDLYYDASDGLVKYCISPRVYAKYVVNVTGTNTLVDDAKTTLTVTINKSPSLSFTIEINKDTQASSLLTRILSEFKKLGFKTQRPFSGTVNGYVFDYDSSAAVAIASQNTPSGFTININRSTQNSTNPSFTNVTKYNAAYKTVGTTGERPSLLSTDVGFSYYDTTLGKPIYWNGSAWIDSNSNLLTEIQVSDKSVLLQASASSNTIEVYTSDEPNIDVKNPDDTTATWLSAGISGTTLTISATANTILVAPEFGDGTYYSESGGDYTQLSTEPNDWNTNYADYYTKEEVYTNVVAESAPEFVVDTYYSKEDESYILLITAPDDWQTNWNDYFTKEDVYSSVESVVAPASNPRGGKVVLTNTTDEVVINVVQSY